MRSGVRPCTLNQINIEPSVLVEIEECGARTHALRHEVRSGASGIVEKLEMRFLRETTVCRARPAECPFLTSDRSRRSGRKTR